MNNTALLEALKRVHEEATKHRKGENTDSWFLANTGICDNVWAAGYSIGGFLKTINPIFKEWPSYSGDIVYPVPSPTPQRTPGKAFEFTDDLWIGRYGNLRMDLLNHCIKTLEKGDNSVNKSPLIDILSLTFITGVLTLIVGLPWVRELWWSVWLGATVLTGCLLAIIDQN